MSTILKAGAFGIAMGLAPLAMFAHIPNAWSAPLMPGLRPTDKNVRVPAVDVAYDEWADTQRNRTLPVKIYMPQSITQPLPVIIFSHGLGGSREAAVYLGNYWAQHNYICVFVQHPGSDESIWKPGLESNPGMSRQEIMQSFKKTVGEPVHALERAQDIPFIVDELQRRNAANGLLKGKLDLNAIGIAGHSYGAWTALTASGQRMKTPLKTIDFTEPRIKAAVYLSPTPPRATQDPQVVYGQIAIPAFHFTGTLDNSPVSDAKASERRIPFDSISKNDQYLVILNEADHMVFNGKRRGTPRDLDAPQQALVAEGSTKFFDAYLKKDKNAVAWLKDGAARTAFKAYGTYETKYP